MNRDRIEQELGPEVLTWVADASPDLWEQVARHVAVQVACALAVDEGSAAWDPMTHEALTRDPSPAVRAIAATLPLGRKWSAHLVALATAQYFELWSASRDVYDAVRSHIKGCAL
jgi:hypothetical protein